ncbi:MAG: hypothetical protein MUF64_24055 [Polyangiaceae bacterium]|nr:hypothetical protein [Polyangiaceae bacterium]
MNQNTSAATWSLRTAGPAARPSAPVEEVSLREEERVEADKYEPSKIPCTD